MTVRTMMVFVFCVFLTSARATEHVLEWHVSGHGITDKFSAKVNISGEKRRITFSFSEKICINQILTGRSDQTDHSTFLSLVGITNEIYSLAEHKIENSGTTAKTQDLLSILYAGLNSTKTANSQPTLPNVSLGIIPIPILPGSSQYLGNISASPITKWGENTVYTNITVTVNPNYSFNYGAILTAHQEGYILMLTHCVISQDEIGGFISRCQGEFCNHDESQSLTRHSPTLFYTHLTQEIIKTLTNISISLALPSRSETLEPQYLLSLGEILAAYGIGAGKK